MLQNIFITENTSIEHFKEDILSTTLELLIISRYF